LAIYSSLISAELVNKDLDFSASNSGILGYGLLGSYICTTDHCQSYNPPSRLTQTGVYKLMDTSTYMQ